MQGNDLGSYFANGLWGGDMPDTSQFAAPMASVPPPQMVVPQVQLQSVMPNMPPQVSGNVSVPMPLGELFASARYQPPAQNQPLRDFGFGVGFRKKF
jgi:hypothetical protein